MYLFFDTETTGLPKNWGVPASNTANWPRMVQLACLLFDDKGNLEASNNYIIRPEGYTIPNDAAKIHGITTERAIREGVELMKALQDFQTLLNRSSQLVAHNMEFDEKIIGAEFYRKTGQDPLVKKPKLCTMKHPGILDYCALPPFRYGNYKWPKLSELHYKLFRSYFDEAHDASVDIHATAKCFWELRRLDIF